MSWKKILVPIAIVGACVAGLLGLVKTQPEVVVEPAAPPPPLVRVIEAAASDVALDVTAQGTVLPRTETTLVAQVAGQITAVSPAFEVGAFFRKGEVLVTLDPRDYEVAARRAESSLAQARLRLEQERAEARLAAEEWRELGDPGREPDPLTLRRPQVAQAEAGVAAAEAELDKARLDLERTRIRAPFDGRLRHKLVDLGQFLGAGTPVAGIHAIDYAEVRLPVTDGELAYLDLPFAYRDRDEAAGPAVELSARFAGTRHVWTGRVVRSEGEIDPKTRMLNLVARVEDPYARGKNPDRPPLAVGLFVDARIHGRLAPGVIVVPRAAVRRASDGGRDEQRVLVVDDDGRLRFRTVEVLRFQGENAVIRGGLEAGETVCVSTLDVLSDGMRVRTAPADTAAAGTGGAR